MILGGTGTLKTLSTSEKNAIEESYGIEKYTYMPSLYGKSKFLFSKETDIHLYNENEYNENLKEEIRKHHDHHLI